MDQPVTAAPSETIEEVMDAVTREDTHRVVQREGKPSVVVMSLPTYWRIQPGPAWLEALGTERKRMAR